FSFTLPAPPAIYTLSLHDALPILGTVLLQPVANPFFGVIALGSIAGPTVPQSQLLRPYPQFSGVTRMAPAFGNSHYQAAQFQLRSEEHTSELQSQSNLVCRLLLEK